MLCLSLFQDCILECSFFFLYIHFSRKYYAVTQQNLQYLSRKCTEVLFYREERASFTSRQKGNQIQYKERKKNKGKTLTLREDKLCKLVDRGKNKIQYRLNSNLSFFSIICCCGGVLLCFLPYMLKNKQTEVLEKTFHKWQKNLQRQTNETHYQLKSCRKKTGLA